MNNLVKYDVMCRAIDAAYEVDEVKDIRDKALALEAYAQQAKNTEAERRACEIRLRAERKAGQLLQTRAEISGRTRNGQFAPASSGTIPEASGKPLLWQCHKCGHVWPVLRDDCNNCHEGEQPPANECFLGHPEDGAKTLKELGISLDQSSKWQKLANVPVEEFEAALDGSEKPSTAGILKQNGEASPMDPDALWLWGRLRDFERRGLLDVRPQDLLGEMTDAMKDDTMRLAPLVSDWLNTGETDD